MKRDQKTLLLQGLLFLATFITTTLAGAEWTHGKLFALKIYALATSQEYPFGWADFVGGLSYSIPFLLILTTHELGHYFTARYHHVKSSLPYYIPLPPLPYSLGTLGALIRLRERVPSKRKNFDIGISGPLAGFVMSLVVLWYGFTHLPPPEYIFQIHPEYEQYGLNYADVVYDKPGVSDVVLGKNLIFLFFERFVADPSRIPNPHEMMHYPLLFAGFWSLVFTSLNLLPIGQLDGGHVVYGLFGFKTHRVIAIASFIVLIFYSGLGAIDLTADQGTVFQNILFGLLFLFVLLKGLRRSSRDTLMYTLLIMALLLLINWQFPNIKGYSGWLLFIFVVGRFVGVEHPPSEIEEALDTKRKILGWIGLIVFLLSLTPAPIEIREIPVEETAPEQPKATPELTDKGSHFTRCSQLLQVACPSTVIS